MRGQRVPAQIEGIPTIRCTHRRGAAFFAAFIVVTMVAAACTPPPPPTVKDWQFESTRVTVNEANDCLILTPCGFLGTDTDEAYVLNLAFRVKIGEAGSAQAWVAGSRGNDTAVSEGSSAILSGSAQNTATFNDVATLDLNNLSGNSLEVVGTYVWVMEKDSIGVGLAANSMAGVLEDALNDTLAQAGGTTDPNDILDLIFSNLGSAIGILVGNIPTLGFGDDALGGGFYLGIGATGGLATTLDNLLTSFNIPDLNIPILQLPPDIQEVGVFTMGDTKTFTGQRFDNGGCLFPQCGTHTYNFQTSEA